MLLSSLFFSISWFLNSIYGIFLQQQRLPNWLTSVKKTFQCLRFQNRSSPTLFPSFFFSFDSTSILGYWEVLSWFPASKIEVEVCLSSSEWETSPYFLGKECFSFSKDTFDRSSCLILLSISYVFSKTFLSSKKRCYTLSVTSWRDWREVNSFLLPRSWSILTGNDLFESRLVLQSFLDLL
jgi:hypothetical protein